MSLTELFGNNNHTNNLNHFGSLVNLAFIDGEFTDEEHTMLERFANKLSISDDERKMILDSPEDFTFDKTPTLEKRYEYVYDFFKMIYADHRLDETEYHLVMGYIKMLGFNSVKAKQIINKSIEIFECNISVKDYELLVNNTLL